jgi:hypothetical protein
MKKLLLILAFIVTGTSVAEQKLTRPLIMPPDTICEETEPLLICDELQPTVCERTEGDYLAYISGAVNSPDDLYTTTCKEQSLEGFQRVGDNWESAERPLRTYLITKVKGTSGCDYSDNGITDGYHYRNACYSIANNEYSEYGDELLCLEAWSLESNVLTKITCQIGLSTFAFSPHEWFHHSNFHGDIDRWGAIDNLDTYRQDMLTVSVGQCSRF